MPKPVRRPVTLEEAFHPLLWDWYEKNRPVIRANYRGLTQAFLDHNVPMGKVKPPFLREPQAQALELYVFLKERMCDRSAGGRVTRLWPIYEIFENWYTKQTPFAERKPINLETDAQKGLFDSPLAEAQYKGAFKRLRDASGDLDHPNYIFALTMGTGKTLLMLTCIFYDFIMAKAYPRDVHYAHNALIFAPDKTVLQTLRQDIDNFDRRKVVPADHLPVIDGVLTRFLDDDSASLTGLAERFNIVVSNAQKIIRKKRSKPRTESERLFKSGTIGESEQLARAMLDTHDVESEEELVPNQRLTRIKKLRQLAVFIDEAHHAFGADLADNMDPAKATSVRRTVLEIARELQQRETRVVGCYNFTGTPYAKGVVFPEVVYSYGLKKGIDAAYLKRVHIESEPDDKVKEAQFLRRSVKDFLAQHKDKKYEGLLPKLAIFVPKVKDVREVEKMLPDVLADAGLSMHSVLVNVGDEKLTSSEELREFNRLDKPESKKQIILLVGKGKEGWNCRSLFGVILFRKPDSRVFVLQATMRCLRGIAQPPPQTGRIYLSASCEAMLNAELEENFRITIDELQAKPPKEKVTVNVKPVAPIPSVKIRRTINTWTKRPVEEPDAPDFGFSEAVIEKYRAMRKIQDGLRPEDHDVRVRWEEISEEQQAFTALSLVGEIARYLNRSPVLIDELLSRSPGGIERVLLWVNRHNQLLYDHVIPVLFRCLYDEKPNPPVVHEEEILLVREPKDGHYTYHVDPDKLKRREDHAAAHQQLSFHLDNYCFDSVPEMTFFSAMLQQSGEVERVYFNGMLSRGQTDFCVYYVDPIVNRAMNYYPDFLVKLKSGRWLVVEVKGDDMRGDPQVEAKAAAAKEFAEDSDMKYCLIWEGDIKAGHSAAILAPKYKPRMLISPD